LLTPTKSSIFSLCSYPAIAVAVGWLPDLRLAIRLKFACEMPAAKAHAPVRSDLTSRRFP
jgi:hypothetical protein